MFDTVKVDAGTFPALQFMSAQAKDEFVQERQPGDERKQKVNKDGVPLWKVQLTAVNWRGRADTLTVSIPMTAHPAEKFEPMQPVTLPGLTFGSMRKRDGSGSSLWWSADGIEAAASKQPGQ